MGNHRCNRTGWRHSWALKRDSEQDDVLAAAKRSLRYCCHLCVLTSFVGRGTLAIAVYYSIIRTQLHYLHTLS